MRAGDSKLIFTTLHYFPVQYRTLHYFMRQPPGGCVLPSGRFAVVGGIGVDYAPHANGEVHDPVQRTWEPLPDLPVGVNCVGVVPVTGGMMVFGITDRRDRNSDELMQVNLLFEDASGHWYTLPHPRAQPQCAVMGVAALPAVLVEPARLQ